jgi:4-amino-4-deoxy-L-arabinose transferase-like glycosyltransferase
MTLPLARSRPAATMAGLVCCAVLARLPYVSNVGVDESYYLVVARQWLEGTPPYVGAFDVKPPLLFALMAGAETLFGPTLYAAKAVAMASVAATACALYLFGRRFTGELAGLAAALFYIAASLTLGGAFSPAELIMAPFTAFGMLLGLTAARSKKPRPSLLLAAGLLLGAAACVKQTAIFEAAALLLYLGANLGLRRGVKAVAWLGAGLCAVPAGFAVYFFAQGHLDAFVADAVFGAIGRAGATYISWGEAAERLLIALLLVAPLVIMAAAAFALRSAFRGETAYLALTFLMMWTAAALAAVFAARALCDFYMLASLPPLCSLSGVFLHHGIARFPGRRPWVARAAAFGCVMLFLASMPSEGRVDDASAAAKAATAMKAAGLKQGERIFVADRDLVIYLAASAEPMGPIFHPLQLLCEFASSKAGDALAVALKSRPPFIVATEPPVPLACEKKDRRALLDDALAKNYRAIGHFGAPVTSGRPRSFAIYQRL